MSALLAHSRHICDINLYAPSTITIDINEYKTSIKWNGTITFREINISWDYVASFKVNSILFGSEFSTFAGQNGKIEYRWQVVDAKYRSSLAMVLGGCSRSCVGYHLKKKYCQTHNGPKGWVLSANQPLLCHITTSYRNLDQNSTSKPWANFSLNILTKLQRQNLNKNSAVTGAHQYWPPSKIID